jgi:hypothetical protein
MNSWKYFLVGGLLLGAASCEKEEMDDTPALGTRIEGSWDIAQVEVTNADAGTSYTADPDGRFTFEACNINPNIFCPYTQESSYSAGGVTFTTSEAGEHRITDAARILELRVPRETGGGYDVTRYEILTRINNMMRIRHIDENGTATTFILNKE